MTARTVGIIAAPLALAAVLAGCAAPDESREPVPDAVPGDEPVETMGTGEYVLIDGRPYECHDTLDTDGICDDYELDEGYTAADENTPSVTSSNGRVTIGGVDYMCTDTMMTDVDITDPVSDVGRCETYRLMT